MSAPFGGHPTLKQYLDWVLTEGFSYRTGYLHDGVNNVAAVMIENADGQPLLSIPTPNMDEHLAPSTVERLDRRLGVESPFARKPH